MSFYPDCPIYLTSHDVFQRRELDSFAFVVVIGRDQLGDQSMHLLLFKHLQIICPGNINRSISFMAREVKPLGFSSLVPLRLSNWRSRMSWSAEIVWLQSGHLSLESKHSRIHLSQYLENQVVNFVCQISGLLSCSIETNLWPHLVVLVWVSSIIQIGHWKDSNTLTNWKREESIGQLQNWSRSFEERWLGITIDSRSDILDSDCTDAILKKVTVIPAMQMWSNLKSLGKEEEVWLQSRLNH